MYEVKKIKKTALWSPTEWEGITTDNRLVYIRFRWGLLNVYVGQPNNEDVYDVVEFGENYSFRFGEKPDGLIEYIQMKKLVKDIISLPERAR